MKYQTNPCEIEAIQWSGNNVPEICNFMRDSKNYKFNNNELYIETLEGVMKANRYDYIIRGLRGEYYPCKPDVFHRKYKIKEKEQAKTNFDKIKEMSAEDFAKLVVKEDINMLGACNSCPNNKHLIGVITTCSEEECIKNFTNWLEEKATEDNEAG